MIEANEKDEAFMQVALDLARRAEQQSEVPVGAVVISEGEVIGYGSNEPIGTVDPTAHAEIRAIRTACKRVDNYRLSGCELYVTLEPCIMCVGAIIHARINRVIFGAHDPKTGAVVSNLRAFELPFLNHKVQVSAGVCTVECSTLLSSFFQARR